MVEETKQEDFTDRIEQIEKVLLETVNIQKKIEFLHKKDQVENRKWREAMKTWQENAEKRMKKMDAYLEHLSKLAGVVF